MKQDVSLAEELDRGVGLRVRHIRKLRGMTQTQLGGSLRVSFQQIQKYERGTNRISISALILLARALDISPGALLGEDGAERAAPDLSLLSEDGAYELARAVAQISLSEQRRIVFDLAQELASAGRVRESPAPQRGEQGRETGLIADKSDLDNSA